MKIQINTDHNIDGTEEFRAPLIAMISERLSRFSSHISRIEAHLSDENSDQKEGANDMSCMIEARLEHSQTVAVTNTANTVEQSVEGAVDQLKHLLSSKLEPSSDY
jgi:ribosome-associated translation inhibitor RaiA